MQTHIYDNIFFRIEQTKKKTIFLIRMQYLCVWQFVKLCSHDAPILCSHSIQLGAEKTGWLMLSLGYIHIDFLSHFELFDCHFFLSLDCIQIPLFSVIFVVVLYQFMYFIFVLCNKKSTNFYIENVHACKSA